MYASPKHMGLVGEEKLLNCDMIRINLYEYFLQNEWKNKADENIWLKSFILQFF